MRLTQNDLIGSFVLEINENGQELRMFQFDQLPEQLIFKAPVGSRAFDVLTNIYIKIGPKDSDWERSSEKILLQDMLDMPMQMLSMPEKDRKTIVEKAKEGITRFYPHEKGSPSEMGQEILDYLNKDCELIGVCPNIVYILAEKRGGKESLDYIWQHPFSKTSLLYHVKGKPMLIITNGNLDFNDSRLNKNKFNKESTPIAGISG